LRSGAVLHGETLNKEHIMADAPKDTAYTVTKGNIVTDATGKKFAGEKVTLSEKEAAPLKKAKVIE
jgi:predicted phage tail protein